MVYVIIIEPLVMTGEDNSMVEFRVSITEQKRYRNWLCGSAFPVQGKSSAYGRPAKLIEKATLWVDRPSLI